MYLLERYASSPGTKFFNHLSSYKNKTFLKNVSRYVTIRRQSKALFSVEHKQSGQNWRGKKQKNGTSMGVKLWHDPSTYKHTNPSLRNPNRRRNKEKSFLVLSSQREVMFVFIYISCIMSVLAAKASHNVEKISQKNNSPWCVFFNPGNITISCAYSLQKPSLHSWKINLMIYQFKFHFLALNKENKTTNCGWMAMDSVPKIASTKEIT